MANSTASSPCLPQPGAFASVNSSSTIVRGFTKGFLDLITVKFLTGFGHRPQHLLGNFGCVPAILGLFAMAILAVNLMARLVDPSIGIGPLAQIMTAVLSVGLLLFGTQLFIAGLIAELIVDRGSGEDLDPYCISERVGEVGSNV